MSDKSIQENNANVSDEGIKIGEEYDKARDERAKELESSSEQLDEGRARNLGNVLTGTGATNGLVTQFPGAAQRGLADDINSGGVAARAAKGLDTGDVTANDSTWTAQSALGYVEDNSANVPGQTYTLEQLPDPEVVNASSLPAHAIPADLVVDGVVTDDINPTQEDGGDVGTAPRHVVTNPSTTGEVDGETPADRADGTESAKRGGRAAGRKAGQA